MFWVYLLHCADDSHYIGHTDNLDLRIAQQQVGAAPTCYTFSRRPLQLVYSQEFSDREQAISMERKLKGWSRAKKAAPINPALALICSAV
jgi:putative endonuclease